MQKREVIKEDTNGIGTGRLMGHGLKVELFLLASGWFEERGSAGWWWSICVVSGM
jgi:hypothetical protein